MIISVEELKQYITTDKADKVLEVMIQALELSIRKYTNNNFQKVAVRCVCNVTKGVFTGNGPIPFKVNETVQISESGLNEGIYTIASVGSGIFTVNEDVEDESNILVTKVKYPSDVVMGVVEIIRWKLKNEAENSNDTSQMRIQSESLSRHSVTYAADTTESDIDENFGVPKKYLAFLKMYKKARF